MCTAAGKSRSIAGLPYPPHRDRHPAEFLSVAVGRCIQEYQLVYISAGAGTLEVDSRHYALAAGSVFLLFPGVAHAHRPDPGTGWTEWWVGFKGLWADALLCADAIHPSRPMYRPAYQARLVSGFESIFEHIRRQSALYQFHACAEVMRMLTDILSAERMASVPNRTQEVVERIRAFIDDSLGTGFDLRRIEAELRVTAPSQPPV